MRESGSLREAAFFVLSHVREAFDRLREALYRLVRVAVLDTVAHTVVDVSLEDYLPDAVERGLRGVYLREHVLARDILVHHPVDGLYLPDDFIEPSVKVLRVHTLSHSSSLRSAFMVARAPPQPQRLACRVQKNPLRERRGLSFALC